MENIKNELMQAGIAGWINNIHGGGISFSRKATVMNRLVGHEVQVDGTVSILPAEDGTFTINVYAITRPGRMNLVSSTEGIAADQIIAQF